MGPRSEGETNWREVGAEMEGCGAVGDGWVVATGTLVGAWNGTEDGWTAAGVDWNGMGDIEGVTSGNWTSISASIIITVSANGESAGWMNVTWPETLLMFRTTMC